MPIMNSDEHNHGILLVNKPAGETSFSLVRALRRRFNVKKIGHAGTLDPFATGLMVMLIGKQYTRMSDTFINDDKEYIATMLLGITTDSYDCDGAVLKTSEHIPTEEDINNAVKQFCGKIEQTPPMFSAKKVNGKKLYELARKGKEIYRKPSLITVETTITSYEYPIVKMHIECSKGTYIRSIAHDLGNSLECGGHLIELHRIRCGKFHVNDSIDGNLLESNDTDIEKWILSKT